MSVVSELWDALTEVKALASTIAVESHEDYIFECAIRIEHIVSKAQELPDLEELSELVDEWDERDEDE
jgi:hypothetical protein